MVNIIPAINRHWHYKHTVSKNTLKIIGIMKIDFMAEDLQVYLIK